MGSSSSASRSTASAPSPSAAPAPTQSAPSPRPTASAPSAGAAPAPSQSALKNWANRDNEAAARQAHIADMRKQENDRRTQEQERFRSDRQERMQNANRNRPVREGRGRHRMAGDRLSQEVANPGSTTGGVMASRVDQQRQDHEQRFGVAPTPVNAPLGGGAQPGTVAAPGQPR